MLKYGVFVLLYINSSDGETTRDVLERITEYSEIFEHILVVDNSKKSHQAVFKDSIRTVSFHHMGYNAGISKALDYAFSWAQQNQIDFLLTMDQDSIYPNAEIRNMMEYIESDEKRDCIAIYAANYQCIYHKNDKPLYTAPAVARNAVKEIDFAMTSGSFVRVKYTQAFIPLPDYFVSYVDIDLSAKLHEAGYSIVRVGASIFNQQVGSDVKATKYNMFFHVLHHSETRYYLMTRNNCYFRSNHPEYQKEGVARLLRIFANIILGERQKVRKLRACYQGYLDFRKGIMGNIPEGTRLQEK